MSGHERRAVRQFEDELKRGGWRYEDTDGGRTVWFHPDATGDFRLPVAPRHFDVQRARRDVARLLGEQPAGKRSGKGKPTRQRQDFVVGQAMKTSAPPRRATATSSPPPSGPARRTTGRRLPWEGADQPDHYDHGIDALMRTVPGGRR